MWFCSYLCYQDDILTICHVTVVKNESYDEIWKYYPKKKEEKTQNEEPTSGGPNPASAPGRYSLKPRFYRFLKSEFRVVIRFLNKPFL